MTYGDKYDIARYSTYRFYRAVINGREVFSEIGRLYPNVLDHVVLDDDDVDAILITQVAQSLLVDDAAASIQRFASRCLAADKSEMMMNAMSQALMDSLWLCTKPIIDVFSFYGAKLDPNDDSYFNQACLLGMNDVVQQAIENGHHVANGNDVKSAIESGNCDTIKLVFGAYRGNVNVIDISLFNATVQSMELCLSLNIIQHGKRREFSDISSFSVLQWILDHDVMEHDEMLIDIASNASRYSGHYFDMLRYLIEQRNFTVPRDILLKLDATYLDVLDYFLWHGGDLNADDLFGQSVLECSPLLIRYWIDKGLVVYSNDGKVLVKCIQSGMTVPVLEMMIDTYSMDVNDVDRNGRGALHDACECNKVQIVEMLIRRGADVNKRCSIVRRRPALGANHHHIHLTPYDMTSNDRIKQLLGTHGYHT